MHGLTFAMLLLAAAALPGSAAADAMRTSTGYGIQFDVISAGGGAVHSTSFQQPQTVIGQSAIWANYASAGYQSQPIGTALIPNSASSVAGWSLY